MIDTAYVPIGMMVIFDSGTVPVWAFSVWTTGPFSYVLCGLMGWLRDGGSYKREMAEEIEIEMNDATLDG